MNQTIKTNAIIKTADHTFENNSPAKTLYRSKSRQHNIEIVPQSFKEEVVSDLHTLNNKKTIFNEESFDEELCH